MSNIGSKMGDVLGPLLKLYNHYGKYRKYVVVAILFGLVSSALSVIAPYKIQELIDAIVIVIDTGTIDMRVVTALSVMLIAIYVLSGAFDYIQNLLLVKASAKDAKKLRSEMMEKMDHVPLSQFDKSSTGDVLSRVTNDLDIVGEQTGQSVGVIITAATMFVGSIIMMFFTNWIMALISIVISIIGILIMTFMMSKTQKYYNAQQKTLGDLNGMIQENYSGHDIIKIYNGTDDSIKVHKTINEKYRAVMFKSLFWSELMMPIMTFVGNIGYVAVCIGGIILYVYGVCPISMGVIVAFMFYVRLFNNSLSQVSEVAMQVQLISASAKRVFEFLEIEEMDPEIDKNEVLRDVKGSVEFRDVHFRYASDKEIIHGFSMNVEPGQKVAIVGPTGAGKTTIVNLLMRFYDLSGGDILIDGISINSVSRKNVHEQFCMVLQDSWVFEGTIKDNIRFSNEHVGDEEIINACKTVGIHHFVESLPKKYDTVLNDKISISSGQRQQLTIARAIVQDAPMLILDEATSSIDTMTEKMIQEAMDRLMKNRTSFIIAHRLSTIRNADVIMVMNNGNIVEHGSHDELIEKKGFYYSLYSSQFANGR